MHSFISGGKKVILPTTALNIYIVYVFPFLQQDASQQVLICMNVCFLSLLDLVFFISITAGISGVFALCTEACWCNKLLIFHSDRISLSSAIKERWQIKARPSYNTFCTSLVIIIITMVGKSQMEHKCFSVDTATAVMMLALHSIACVSRW